MPVAGEVVAELIEANLEWQAGRKASLEQARANNAAKARSLRRAVGVEPAAIAALGGATVASLL